jgi:hypothetical protein
MPREAVEQYKRVLADTEALRGRDHPETIAARAGLAAAMPHAGKSRRGRLIPGGDAGTRDRGYGASLKLMM